MAAPERLQAAILYAELRNFTRLSEVLEPAKVLQLANDFFTLVAAAVTTSGGAVLAVQNDSVAACFTGDKQALAKQALEAAQTVQREFGALGVKWKTDYGLPAAGCLRGPLGGTVVGIAGAGGAQPRYSRRRTPP